MKGYFPLEELDTYCQDGGRLAEHPPANLLPGVEAATGSLGHGLPLGCGMALSGRIKGETFRVFALLSDGENNEGSVWEAAMFAAAQKLENVCVIVDYNKWQATGALQRDPDAGAACATNGRRSAGTPTRSTATTSARWRTPCSACPTARGKPVALIAHTVKGKGVSFMEDDNNWHYRAPTADEVVKAHKELGLA